MPQNRIFKQKIVLKQKFGVEFKSISDSPLENVDLIEMFLLNLTIQKKFNRKKTSNRGSTTLWVENLFEDASNNILYLEKAVYSKWDIKKNKLTNIVILIRGYQK